MRSVTPMLPLESRMLNRCEHFRQCSSAGQIRPDASSVSAKPKFLSNRSRCSAANSSAGMSTWPNAYFDCSISSCSRTSRYFTPPPHSRSKTLSTLLQEHRDALEPVGDLAGDRREVDAADLLEVGELRDLHAVEQHLPADAPGAERRRLPVVLLEADVVLPRVDAARLEAVEIDLLHFVGRRLEDHLVLVVLEQAVRVLAEAAVVGPARRLHVGDAPRLGPEHAEQRLGMRGAGADLEVERLLQQAAVRGPERRQLEDEVLEGHAACRITRDGEGREARGRISTSSPDAS